MLTKCNVSGAVYAPDGLLARDRSVTFHLRARQIIGQGDNTIVPQVVVAQTDANGLLQWLGEDGTPRAFVPLAPGSYEVRIFDLMGAPFPKVRIGVPLLATANFAQIIDAPAPSIPTPSNPLPIGVEGQVVGYGPDGIPQAIDLPEGTIPPGSEGQLVGYGPGGVPVAVDGGAGGSDGRGIASEAYDPETGVLTLTFTDGTTYQTGDLRGVDGEDGNDGDDGNDGRGIASEAYDPQTGVLTLTFTDGTTYQTGDLRGVDGEDGNDGDDGNDGRGIASEAYDPQTGVLTLTFTDGTTYQTGDLRGVDGEDGNDGDDGNDGRGIASEAYDPQTGVLTLTFTDGTTYQTEDLRGADGEDGNDGDDGTSVTITTVNTQAAFDAATPGPLEIVVRVA
jgi:frataxin-like iron-binding protein CyaY